MIEETPQKVVYEYFPEGITEVGIISFDKETKMNSIVTPSSKDKYQLYAQKLFSRIREFSNSNSFKKTGMIAWYSTI